jgi:prepilin-type N-terminal cleavage/methylation domain-containing protein
MRDHRKPYERERGRGPAEGGFTLVEIAIAIAVLAIALMGLGFAMINAWRLERSAGERKIALQWATAQMESVRAMGVAGCTSAPPDGYLIPLDWTGASSVGFHKDVDADGDPEIFGRFYGSNPNAAAYTSPTAQVVPVYDSLLLGLRPMPGTTRVGEVVFSDPDGTTGVTEGDGYWVTIFVRWTGVQGPQEMKIGSFIAQ